MQAYTVGRSCWVAYWVDNMYFLLPSNPSAPTESRSCCYPGPSLSFDLGYKVTSESCLLNLMSCGVWERVGINLESSDALMFSISLLGPTAENQKPFQQLEEKAKLSVWTCKDSTLSARANEFRFFSILKPIGAPPVPRVPPHNP